jgi:hypothetical protein
MLKIMKQIEEKWKKLGVKFEVGSDGAPYPWPKVLCQMTGAGPLRGHSSQIVSTGCGCDAQDNGKSQLQYVWFIYL